MQPVRIIKKYPNRRLYDTTEGCYITLEDIKKFVLDRTEFQVIDVRDKKDITQNTLLQIILEQEASNTPLFTTPILLDMIRFYHEKSQHWLSQFQNQWLTYQEMVKKMWSIGSIKNSPEDKK